MNYGRITKKKPLKSISDTGNPYHVAGLHFTITLNLVTFTFAGLDTALKDTILLVDRRL